VADGFVGRWSRRKQEARTGLPEGETPASAFVPAVTASAKLPANAVTKAAPQENPQETVAKAPLPTLEDVKALTAESDFRPFVARDVEPEVRNAAMKKLFADPHYNVMDGLDTYIDDYSKPDPIPASMLRQLASAKFLNLFDEDEDKDKTQTAPAAQPPVSIPAAAEPVALPNTTPPDHDHTDLRLQQDHAAGAQGSGDGAG
jgi:hypothetical protein